jgi:lysophospholipase L1-like esterase
LTPQGPYVALGDSYTSGPDIPNQTGSPAGCDRSDRNYPALLAAHLKLSASGIHDVSCSGATIADLTAPQTTENGTNPPQLGALAADTSLVTVGIGGNDLDFSGVLTRCVELDAPGTILGLLRHSSTDTAPCRTYYTGGGADQIGQKIKTSATELASALARIRGLAPHARVLVVGYPDLLPATDGTACAHTLGITAGDVAYLDTEELALNSMLRQQAAAAHDTYVDTYAPSLGHDACSDAATRWIEPLLPDASAAPLHPNSVGEQGVAEAVERALRG